MVGTHVAARAPGVTRRSARGSSRCVVSRGTTPETSLNAPGLIGRQAELAAIQADVDRTRGGACRIVLLRGDAGTGKSRLLVELIRTADVAGFQTAIGRAEDHDRGVPFASLRLALRDRLLTESAPRLVETAAELLAVLFGGSKAGQTSSTPAVSDLTHRLISGWADRGPFLLAIDDLHCADPETLDVFGFLARHLRGSRVLLAATTRVRHHDLPPDAAAAIDGLRAWAATTVLELGAFGDADLRSLVSSILDAEPSPELLGVIDEATSGNPFFTVELVRALRDENWVVQRDGSAGLPSERLVVPATAAVAVLHRVFRLGESARAVARVASAFSTVTLDQLPLVATISGLDRAESDSAFDMLTRAGVLEPAGTGFRFTYAIVRSALYDDLGPAERRRVHAQIAASMWSRRERDLPVDAVELATHVRACAEPGDRQAAQFLMEAGDRLVGVAPRSAVQWYRDGLQLLPTGSEDAGLGQLGLARALSVSSRHDAAASAAAEAMATLPPGAAWSRAAALRIRSLAASGKAQEADRLFVEFGSNPELRRPQTMAQHAFLLDSLDRLEEAHVLIAQASAAAVGKDVVPVDTVAMHLAMSRGDWATGRHLADRLEEQVLTFPPLLRGSTAISLLHLHSHNGDPHRALDVAALFGESPLWASVAAGPLARALVRVGRWDDGVAVAAEAARREEDRGLLYMAWLAVATVAGERAAPPLDVEVVRDGLGRIDVYPSLTLLCLAHLALAESRVEEARRLLDEAWRSDRRSGRRNALPWTLDLAAELAWTTGERRVAVQASAELDELGDEEAWLAARLNALLTRAVVLSDLDSATRAEALASEHDLPLERARAIAARGAIRDDTDALGDAYSRFRALGAVRRQRDVSAELRRLGKRVPRGQGTTNELTVAERQLAALVAQGFTNREVAERVHLSAKTIEVYLGRIFRKVGCTTRLELALAVNNGQLDVTG